MSSFHDKQYLSLISDVLTNGSERVDRTGVGTIAVFGRQMRFDLSDGTIPLLTTKKMHLPSIVHELLWYLQGSSNVTYLRNNGVRIWNEWSSPEGHLNKVYGFQWRKWEVEDWKANVCVVESAPPGCDAPFEADPNNTSHQKTVYGEGCIGDYVETPHYRLAAYDLWLDMMKSCYHKESAEFQHMGWRGVFVDKSWRCFANFLRDIHDLPYFSKWVATPSKYVLDISYKRANYFGAQSCVFIPVEYHEMLKCPTAMSGATYTAVDKMKDCSVRVATPELFASQQNLDVTRLRTVLQRGETYECNRWSVRRDASVTTTLRQQLYVDQIAELIHTLKTNPTSRRMLVSAWNVGQLEQMALPPCHYSFQCFTSSASNKDQKMWPGRSLKLSMILNMRSNDVGLGNPFNIAQYSMLLRVLCEIVGMVPGDFIWSGGDVHIYTNHIPQLKDQLTRTPYPSPKLKFSRPITSVSNLTFDDFVVGKYTFHPSIAMKVAV